jgi:hypothetical protein
VENVAGCEAKQSNSRGDQPVLAAVVLDQAGPVRASVVFQREPVTRIEEIEPAEK